ncbi:MAG: hypothetical protein RBS23_06590 [Mariniphaga sp.]|nr:hypothetical protein [Mariniphaga sp.]
MVCRVLNPFRAPDGIASGRCYPFRHRMASLMGDAILNSFWDAAKKRTKRLWLASFFHFKVPSFFKRTSKKITSRQQVQRTLIFVD